ncbi:MAG: hypothetical protein WD844_08375 [Thermoleophilaceae bacterium]
MLRLSASAPPRPAPRSRAPEPAPAPAAPRSIPFERLAPALVAALLAAVYLLVEPRTVDFAAHEFRTDLFAREGFTLWNGQWYGGHHTVAYSVLFPPLAWLLSPALVGAVSAVASAALFEPLARGRWGERARWGALWFGVGSATLLFTGRLPFGMGVALGIAALLALQRRRPALAAVLAVLCSLASPVAGLFLALAGVALGFAGLRLPGEAPRSDDRAARRDGALIAAASLTPPVLLALAFPEGGHEPFVLSAFLPLPLFALGAALLLPAREHALRIGAALYGLAGIAAWLIETPMGGNAVRLGALFGGPVLLCALGWSGSPRRRALLAAGFLALAVWQWSPAVRDVVKSIEDPSAEAAYYAPLLDFLREHPGEGRIEIPFTRSHWEAAEIAPEFPLARGWQRQLDVGRNQIFYDGVLNDLTYASWLAEHGVRYVALPSAKPDYSAYGERALVERDPGYLREVWSSQHWRVYEVLLPHPLVISDRDADIRLVEMRSDEFILDVREPGSALVRASWTPYWKAHGGCVERDGDWTRVSASEAGRLRVTTTFSVERVVSRGQRCSKP